MSKIEKAFALRGEIQDAASLQTDDVAVDTAWMYEEYQSLVDRRAEVEKGFRFRFGDGLWRTEQTKYTFDGQWSPGDPGTESLFSKVEKRGEGTHDNPIAYNNNMELYEGKYYSHKDSLYYCFRSTGQPVYADLDQLIDLYVRVSN